MNENSSSDSDEEHDANGNYQSDNCGDDSNIEQNENEEKTKPLSKVRKKKPNLENGIQKEISKYNITTWTYHRNGVSLLTRYAHVD